MEKRLDVYLVDNGFIDSRSRAKSFIMGERKVLVNNKVVTKPSLLIKDNDVVQVEKKNAVEYVSRAGYKLEKAIKIWNLDLKNKVVLDIGASTGGFSECCLINGAKKVVAVDVGHDQLHKSLRSNSKVINIEGFNFKNANGNNLNYLFDFWCCDVSFISLKHIIHPLAKLNLSIDAYGVMLIKPQFESERMDIKAGMAMDKQLHFKAIKKVINLAIENELVVDDITGSPITGNKKGNIEYLMLISRNKLENAKELKDEYIKKIIDDVWTEQNKTPMN